MIPKQEERPAYVTFTKVAQEDRQATIESGAYRTKDVDYALITPVGSKDRIPREVGVWLAELDAMVREERIPLFWAQQYKQAYEAWKRNEEVPLHGTPIKGWQLLSPSQQQNVISANVLTVEDLAQINGEAAQRIGMGANDLKLKAERWLSSAKDVGKITLENENLRMENKLLRDELEVMTRHIKQLEAKLEVPA